jgi:hypothetical protein
MPPSDHVSTEPELAPEPATKPARQSHRQARIEHLVTLATNAFAKHEICSLTETSIVIKRRLEDGSWSVSHATEIVAGALSHLIVTGDIDTVVFARQGGSLRARLGWIAPTIANADVAAKYLSGRDADFDYLVEKATIGMSCGRKLATEFVAELAKDLIAELVEDAENNGDVIRVAALRAIRLPADESEAETAVFIEALGDAGISDAWEYASWLYAVSPRVVYAWAACRKAAELIDAQTRTQLEAAATKGSAPISSTNPSDEAPHAE